MIVIDFLGILLEKIHCLMKAMNLNSFIGKEIVKAREDITNMKFILSNGLSLGLIFHSFLFFIKVSIKLENAIMVMIKSSHRYSIKIID